MQLGGRGTPGSKLLVKLSGTLRLTGHHHEGQIELFVKSGNQVGPGGIKYDCLMLTFGCGQLSHQLPVGRQFLEQRKQTRKIHTKK
jgi:predicted MPP superfamily phosphohydrolase